MESDSVGFDGKIVLRVLGVPVQFCCDTPSLYRLITESFHSNVSITEKAYAVVELRHSSEFSRPLDFPPIFKLGSESLVGRTGATSFSAKRASRSAVIEVCDGMLVNNYAFRHQVLNTACYYLLTYDQLAPVHAASFILGSSVFICVGPSGAGKSTLAMGAQMGGLTVVSEDILFLSGKSGIWSDCRELHLNPDVFDMFSPGGNSEPQTTHNGKLKHIVKNTSWAVGRASLSPSASIILVLESESFHGEPKILPINRHVTPATWLRGEEPGFNMEFECWDKASATLSDCKVYRAAVGSSLVDFFGLLENIATV
jgi:hypothetical protein